MQITMRLHSDRLYRAAYKNYWAMDFSAAYNLKFKLTAGRWNAPLYA
jgi:hypothetical protein